jgi:tetratricopeptide (TPR) repeat protein
MRALMATMLVVSFAVGLYAADADNWSSIHSAGVAEADAGHDREALRLFYRTWASAQLPDEQAVSAEEIGILLQRDGDTEQAKCWLQRARAGMVGLNGADLQLSKIDMVLGGIARDGGDYATAEAFLRVSLSELPTRDRASASTQNALADMLREQGRAGEAAALFAAVLSLDDITPRQRIDALLGAADIDRGLGAWQASADKWNAAIAAARAAGDELAEAIALRGLGGTWFEAGIPARAEPLLREALRRFKANPNAPGEQTAAALTSLAELYRGENKLTLAEEAYSEALKLDRQLLGVDHPQTAKLLEGLSIVYALRGNIATARDLSAQASNLMSNAFGAQSLPLAGALATQALVEMQAKDLNAAAEFYRQALDITRHYPDNQRMELRLIERYSAVMQALHRGREVEGLRSEAKTLNTYFKAAQFNAGQLH